MAAIHILWAMKIRGGLNLAMTACRYPGGRLRKPSEQKKQAERRGDATLVDEDVSISRGDLVKAELREKKDWLEGDSQADFLSI
jgi:hypothetical protein